MDNKKNLRCIIALFVLIIPIASTIQAYQEMHEPDIIHVEYASDKDACNTIGMYRQSYINLRREIGKDCLQESLDQENFAVSLLNTENCNSANIIFSNVVELYEESLNAPEDEFVVDKARKDKYLMLTIDGKKELKYLSVQVHRVKKIITSLYI